MRERTAPRASLHLTTQLLSGHFASSLATCGPWPALGQGPGRRRSPLGLCGGPGHRVLLQPLPRGPVAEALWGAFPHPALPCPTCLQGLQRANRCGRAFEISVPYKFKVFGNGFLINLPTLSFWKRQKSQMHSHFNLPWYFLSRWPKSCLLCVLCSSI